ncbi:MAG: SEC-C metal-binding domain-containing protein [Candidatus Helarchaeota archaeon]
MFLKTRIEKEFKQVKQRYKKLELIEIQEGDFSIEGMLEFSGEFNKIKIDDHYFIRIKINEDYPTSLPIAFELDERIPKDFHHYTNGSLCLGPPLRLKNRFRDCPNLLFFIDDILLSYLYSYSYFEKYGELPFGQYSHEGKGLYEYYNEIFLVNDINVIINFLKIIEEDAYRGHIPCPCGSNKKFRNCHGKNVLEIKQFQSNDEFRKERKQIEAFKNRELRKSFMKYI